MTRPSRAALALLVSSQLACSSVTDSASDDVAGSPSEPAFGDAVGVDAGGSSELRDEGVAELEPDQVEPRDDTVAPEAPTSDAQAETESTSDTELTSDDVATDRMEAETEEISSDANAPIDVDGEAEIDTEDQPETDLEAPPADTMPLQCPPISVTPCADGSFPSISCTLDDAGDLQYVIGGCPDPTPPACEAPEGDEVDFLTLDYDCATGLGLALLRSEDEVREYCNLSESAPPTGVDFSTHAIYASSFAPAAQPLFVTDQGERLVVGLQTTAWCSGNFPPSAVLMLRIPATDLAVTEQQCVVGNCPDDGPLP